MMRWVKHWNEGPVGHSEGVSHASWRWEGGEGRLSGHKTSKLSTEVQIVCRQREGEHSKNKGGEAGDSRCLKANTYLCIVSENRVEEREAGDKGLRGAGAWRGLHARLRC